MTIEEQIKAITHLHDEYAAIRYNEHSAVGPVGMIDMFNIWHSKSSVLSSKHISPDDVDFLDKSKVFVKMSCLMLLLIS